MTVGPGLFMRMGVGGGVGGGSSSGAQNAAPAPATAGQAAFGTQYTSAGSSGGGGLLQALKPNDAFGIAHLSGLVATGFLVWLWWTLPA